MRNIHNKQVRFLGMVAGLVLTGCTSLLSNVPTPKLGIFTQQELNEARRVRNDPRLYGVQLESAHYARYLKVTGQETK
jgi:hypothetical protein